VVYYLPTASIAGSNRLVMFYQEDSMLRMAWIAIAVGLTLSGCGSTKGERATTGAG
jgi:hypothetical protein